MVDRQELESNILRVVDKFSAGGARIRHSLPDVRFSVRTQAGAQCGSSARWDLRGGRRAIAVPTSKRITGVGQRTDRSFGAERQTQAYPDRNVPQSGYPAL